MWEVLRNHPLTLGATLGFALGAVLSSNAELTMGMTSSAVRTSRLLGQIFGDPDGTETPATDGGYAVSCLDSVPVCVYVSAAAPFQSLADCTAALPEYTGCGAMSSSVFSDAAGCWSEAECLANNPGMCCMTLPGYECYGAVDCISSSSGACSTSADCNDDCATSCESPSCVAGLCACGPPCSTSSSSVTGCCNPSTNICEEA